MAVYKEFEEFVYGHFGEHVWENAEISAEVEKVFKANVPGVVGVVPVVVFEGLENYLEKVAEVLRTDLLNYAA